MKEKVIAWLHGEVKTPPFSIGGRKECGELLRRLQRGELLSMPVSRPMPSIGKHCHELRIRDGGHFWRIVYRIDPDAILILDVFSKKTEQTPVRIIEACKRRLKQYDEV